MSMNITGANLYGTAQVWSGASAPMSPNQKMSNLFDAIDTSGTGTISKSQFEQAFQSMNPPGNFQAAGVDSIWSKLDPNGTGSVSKQDFVNGMAEMMKQLRGHHHHNQGGGATGAQSLAQSTSLLSALGNSASSSTVSTAGTGSTGSLLDILA